MNALSKLLPLNAFPYLRYAKRLLFGAGSLETVSYKQEVLCPEETQEIRPAIFLPGQLERVTGTAPDGSLDRYIKSMLASEYQHAPTIAYHLKNAVLFDGSVYVGNYRNILVQEQADKRNPEPRYFRQAALASSGHGNKYFGHWLVDDCAQYLLAEQSGLPICVSEPLSDHKAQYARYFEQAWNSINRARVDDLIIFQDFGQNSHKQKRFDILRNHVRKRFPNENRQSFVYLRRGKTGSPRNIENENEILDVLVGRHGFEIIDIDDSLDRILSILSKARIVVSIEGSQLAHSCFPLSTEAGMLVLMPPDRFMSVYREWSAGLGFKFGFVVGSKQESGYRFSIDEILATLDLMLKSMGS
jgi:capsular polysaccharide biosynthesis protein